VGWLGTEFGSMDFSERERADLRNCEATVEDYGVPFSSHVFQYVTLVEALSEAADYVEAQIVFATVPNSIIPYWQEFQVRRLRHLLAHHGRQLLGPDHVLPGKSSEIRTASSIPASHSPVR
jgi:hypothetical protein